MRAIILIAALAFSGCMKTKSVEKQDPNLCSEEILRDFYDVIYSPEMIDNPEAQRQYADKIETLHQCDLGFEG